jgi:hypothetical protein
MSDKPVDLRPLKIISKPANEAYAETYDRIASQVYVCTYPSNMLDECVKDSEYGCPYAIEYKISNKWMCPYWNKETK